MENLIVNNENGESYIIKEFMDIFKLIKQGETLIIAANDIYFNEYIALKNSLAYNDLIFDNYINGYKSPLNFYHINNNDYIINHKILIDEYILYLEVLSHFRTNLPRANDILINIQYEILICNPNLILKKRSILFLHNS